MAFAKKAILGSFCLLFAQAAVFLSLKKAAVPQRIPSFNYEY